MNGDAVKLLYVLLKFVNFRLQTSKMKKKKWWAITLKKKINFEIEKARRFTTFWIYSISHLGLRDSSIKTFNLNLCLLKLNILNMLKKFLLSHIVPCFELFVYFPKYLTFSKIIFSYFCASLSFVRNIQISNIFRKTKIKKMRTFYKKDINIFQYHLSLTFVFFKSFFWQF